ncbi:MAG TPA: glycoside hydrolase family 71/99-like protein [Fimbriimonas sp.]|nr:glycoside hydrolase family 71/99-like protein [Fimbriimonas sp.]
MLFSCLFAALSATPAIDASSLEGKVLFGYQGWFRTPGDGSPNGWSHWNFGAQGPSPTTIAVDLFPDLSEFDKKDLALAPGLSRDGKQVYLFSSHNNNVIQKHFDWMKTYGLDGVLAQRFISDIPILRREKDQVLRNIINSAEKTGRVFAVEYDVSGADPDTVLQELREDWEYLTKELQITKSPSYLHHNSKPVVSVWGIGLEGKHHPPHDAQTALGLVQSAQKDSGVFYMGGVPSFWRTRERDAKSDPAWKTTYATMNVVQPWTIGRYRDLAGVERWREQQIKPDLEETTKNGQLYMPVIFPGFSWHNMFRSSPQNEVPRLKGEFLWKQAVNARNSGATMLKIAMFDEVNEATAMFKAVSKRSDAPQGGFWLTLDADGVNVPNDWYLRLAGEITKAFHKKSKLNPTMPALPK